MISNIDNILNYVELSNGIDEDILVKPEIEIFDEFSSDEILENEKSVFGFYLTSHRTEKYKLNNSGITDIYDIKDKLGRRVSIIGSVDKIKEITTKKGESMCFLTVSDNTGSVSVTLFPSMYKLENNFKKNEILKIIGKVEKRFDEYQIVCDKLER